MLQSKARRDRPPPDVRADGQVHQRTRRSSSALPGQTRRASQRSSQIFEDAGRGLHDRDPGRARPDGGRGAGAHPFRHALHGRHGAEARRRSREDRGSSRAPCTRSSSRSWAGSSRRTRRSMPTSSSRTRTCRKSLPPAGIPPPTSRRSSEAQDPEQFRAFFERNSRHLGAYCDEGQKITDALIECMVNR